LDRRGEAETPMDVLRKGRESVGGPVPVAPAREET
jgi:hypothetical protein